jgi:hypothetical protein
MSRAILVALVVVMLCFVAGDRAVALLVDGNFLLVRCAKGGTEKYVTDYQSISYCWGYITGVTDAIEARICVPNGVKVSQLAAVVTLWLRNHPEKLHLPAQDLIEDAFKEKFPCN